MHTIRSFIHNQNLPKETFIIYNNLVNEHEHFADGVGEGEEENKRQNQYWMNSFIQMTDIYYDKQTF